MDTTDRRTLLTAGLASSVTILAPAVAAVVAAVAGDCAGPEDDGPGGRGQRSLAGPGATVMIVLGSHLRSD
jgi:hypothetical protein